VSFFLPRIDILLLWTSTLPERLRSGTEIVLSNNDTRRMSVFPAVVPLLVARVCVRGDRCRFEGIGRSSVLVVNWFARAPLDSARTPMHP
jgi:hypothetical protein